MRHIILCHNANELCDVQYKLLIMSSNKIKLHTNPTFAMVMALLWKWSAGERKWQTWKISLFRFSNEFAVHFVWTDFCSSAIQLVVCICVWNWFVNEYWNFHERNDHELISPAVFGDVLYFHYHIENVRWMGRVY